MCSTRFNFGSKYFIFYWSTVNSTASVPAMTSSLMRQHDNPPFPAVRKHTIALLLFWEATAFIHWQTVIYTVQLLQNWHLNCKLSLRVRGSAFPECLTSVNYGSQCEKRTGMVDKEGAAVPFSWSGLPSCNGHYATISSGSSKVGQAGWRGVFWLYLLIYVFHSLTWVSGWGFVPVTLFER